MLKYLKDLRDLRKAEIWGVVIVYIMYALIIIKMIPFIDRLGAMIFLIMIFCLSLGMIWLCSRLFYYYAVRLGTDDMHEAARNIHTTMGQIDELSKATTAATAMYPKTLSLLIQRLDEQNQP